MRAVILAGGKGTRLRPYTTVLPKPLMPIGNCPIAEVILRQLRHYGATDITFAVGYLHQLIEAYFGDGSAFDVPISYLHEREPLGTAGPLAFLEDFREPILVLNGDILTDLNYSDLYSYHLDHSNEITIASYSKQVKVDLGVIKSDQQGQVKDYIEKPEYSYQVSMGVYVFSPAVLQLIPYGEPLDFPDLVKKALAAGQRVGSYSYQGHWLDIGRTEDYQVAAETFDEQRHLFLPSLPKDSPIEAANRFDPALPQRDGG